MIKEAIVVTTNNKGKAHVAPMGIKCYGKQLIISPFIPSKTFNNLRENPFAVINYIDDVRVFAKCLINNERHKINPTKRIKGYYLQNALTYLEVKVINFKANSIRPIFKCRILKQTILKPFNGFNRAQAAVIEASILFSRLNILPFKKIQKEINYLQIAIDKTAGTREKLAWNLLMKKIKEFKKKG
mgnify:FL=1